MYTVLGAPGKVAERGERIGLVAFPDIRIAVDDVLPWPPVQRHDD